MTDSNRWLELAVRAAREAGPILKRKFRTKIHKELKSEKNLVTEADKASEECLVKILREGCPDCTILTEESPEMKGASGMKWIIDPLDGTTNFAHGLATFSISIGLEMEGQIVVGAVYDPIHDDMYTACKGEGAFLNGCPIHVSETELLGDSLLVTGIPYSVLTLEENNLDLFAAFCFEGQSVRRLGSAALDFCNVAAGFLDGFWELGLQPWDMAAGSLIVQEAGGTVTDTTGAPIDIYAKRQVASNGRIHHQMLNVIRETQEDKD
ncbi:MAG TPA: inositol monophosphatase family protein [bacterium]|nr:inositol monophosphatase family protein [bacterium]